MDFVSNSIPKKDQFIKHNSPIVACEQFTSFNYKLRHYKYVQSINSGFLYGNKKRLTNLIPKLKALKIARKIKVIGVSQNNVSVLYFQRYGMKTCNQLHFRNESFTKNPYLNKISFQNLTQLDITQSPTSYKSQIAFSPKLKVVNITDKALNYQHSFHQAIQYSRMPNVKKVNLTDISYEMLKQQMDNKIVQRILSISLKYAEKIKMAIDMRQNQGFEPNFTQQIKQFSSYKVRMNSMEQLKQNMGELLELGDFYNFYLFDERQNDPQQGEVPQKWFNSLKLFEDPIIKIKEFTLKLQGYSMSDFWIFAKLFALPKNLSLLRLSLVNCFNEYTFTAYHIPIDLKTIAEFKQGLKDFSHKNLAFKCFLEKLDLNLSSIKVFEADLQQDTSLFSIYLSIAIIQQLDCLSELILKSQVATNHQLGLELYLNILPNPEKLEHLFIQQTLVNLSFSKYESNKEVDQSTFPLKNLKSLGIFSKDGHFQDIDSNLNYFRYVLTYLGKFGTLEQFTYSAQGYYSEGTAEDTAIEIFSEKDLFCNLVSFGINSTSQNNPDILIKSIKQLQAKKIMPNIKISVHTTKCDLDKLSAALNTLQYNKFSKNFALTAQKMYQSKGAFSWSMLNRPPFL